MTGYVSRGFHGKREAERENARVPPGQYIVQDFPVLSAGPTPHTPLDEWTFSIVGAGLDPENLPHSDPSKMNFGSGGNTKAKAWKDIWGSGQGIGAMKNVMSAGEYIAKLRREYLAAREELGLKPS